MDWPTVIRPIPCTHIKQHSVGIFYKLYQPYTVRMERPDYTTTLCDSLDSESDGEEGERTILLPAMEPPYVRVDGPGGGCLTVAVFQRARGYFLGRALVREVEKKKKLGRLYTPPTRLTVHVSEHRLKMFVKAWVERVRVWHKTSLSSGAKIVCTGGLIGSVIPFVYRDTWFVGPTPHYLAL